MAIKAKYPGFCPACHQRFKVGEDMIDNNNLAKRWQHVQCPEVPKIVINEKPAVMAYKSATHNFPQAVDVEIDLDALSNVIENVSTSHSVTLEGNQVTFTPSKYQQAFFDKLSDVVHGRTEKKHIVVEAVAGSGKTTTLIEGIKRIKEDQPNLSVCIVAFNKHIAAEFSRKLEKMLGDNHGVLASTKHSLGLRAIRRSLPNTQVDEKGYKLGDIFNEYWPVSKKALDDGVINRLTRKENFAKRASMRSLVSISKSVMVDYNNPQAIADMIERYGIEIDMQFLDEAITTLPKIMKQCQENTDKVDFDDMGWLPIVLNMSIEKFDVLLIDEAQDMSNGDMAFLFRCIADHGHIIAVGDRNQSLYGFRGADTDAIPNIIKMLNAEVLPLSVTYRCPVAVVDLAKKIVPQLEAKENAPAGEVKSIEYINLTHEVQPGDMVICRTNAPLIRPAFECIRLGKKAMIRGADIGSALINLIKRFETDDITSFETSLIEYYRAEFERLLNQAKDMQAVLLTDKVQTLQFIVAECKTVTELMQRIQDLFTDTNQGVVFSSIHRAKGLEADNVFILRPDLMPHPKAVKTWEAQQEQNGIYVAQTRAKHSLIYVKGGENV